MLRLVNLNLYQFRNYPSSRMQFTKDIVAICGHNGVGKTNLLDAIHTLCFTKSYFSRTDASNVLQGAVGMRINGTFEKQGREHEVTCVIRENNKKEFLLDQDQYKKLSLHIGRFPTVMVAPDDLELITGGSEERRKFVDTIISQIDNRYLLWLIDYSRLLQQRNSLLKQAAETGKTDDALFEILDDQLASIGQHIHNSRKEFMREFLPLVNKQYQLIAGKNENIGVNYQSELQNLFFKDLLKRNRSKDFALQRTSSGVHRDDLEFLFNDEPFKVVASQGQRKSLLFALKLAEFVCLQQHKGFSPILLLDDVFEKLDAGRMLNLLRLVCVENRTQVFITDTHKERLARQLDNLNVDYQLIELNQQ